MLSSSKRGVTKYLSFAVRALFTMLLLGFLAASVDLRAVRSGINGGLLPALVVSFVLLMVALAFSALRWVLISRMIEVQLGKANAFIVVMIGHFFNQLLPTSFGGDAVRGWWLCQQGLSVKDSFASVFFDRIFGLFALLGLILVGLPLLSHQLGSVVPTVLFVAILAGLAVGGVLLSHISLDRASNASRFFPQFVRSRGKWIKRIIEQIVIYRSRFLLNPWGSIGAVSLSLAIHFSALYTIAVISNSLGAKLSMLDALLIVPTVLFLTALPISIGGWGVREAGLAGGFSLFGLDPAIAVTASILLGLINLAAGAVGAAIFVAAGSPRPEPD